MIVETALIVIILMAMNLLVQGWVKNYNNGKGIFSTLITDPFQRVRVMMESGTWETADPTAGRSHHPLDGRIYTSKGEVP